MVDIDNTVSRPSAEMLAILFYVSYPPSLLPPSLFSPSSHTSICTEQVTVDIECATSNCRMVETGCGGTKASVELLVNTYSLENGRNSMFDSFCMYLYCEVCLNVEFLSIFVSVSRELLDRKTWFQSYIVATQELSNGG